MRFKRAVINSRFALLLILAILVFFMGLNKAINVIGKAVIRYNIKNSFTEFSKVLDMINIENWSENGCYYSTTTTIQSQVKDCMKFYKRFAKTIKVSRYCSSNSYNQGCVPKYKSYAIDKNCLGFSEEMINKYDQSFVLMDGEIMTIYNYGQNNPMPIFTLDVNGKFPPNRAGQDWFAFMIMRSANGDYYFNPNITFCMPEEKGETFIKNISEVEN